MLKLSFRKLLFLFLFILSFPAAAQPSLQEISSLLAKSQVTRGQFILERKSSSSKRSLKSSGEFVISSENGIIWKTLKPIKSVQVAAKDFSLTESASGKRVKIDGSKNPVYLQMALLTSALWTGDLKAVEGAADIKFLCGEGDWQLELFPKDQAIQMALEKIIVSGTYSEGQAVATEMQMKLKGGNSASYHMSGHLLGGQLSDEERKYFD